MPIPCLFCCTKVCLSLPSLCLEGNTTDVQSLRSAWPPAAEVTPYVNIQSVQQADSCVHSNTARLAKCAAGFGSLTYLQPQAADQRGRRVMTCCVSRTERIRPDSEACAALPSCCSIARGSAEARAEVVTEATANVDAELSAALRARPRCATNS